MSPQNLHSAIARWMDELDARVTLASHALWRAFGLPPRRAVLIPLAVVPNVVDSWRQWTQQHSGRRMTWLIPELKKTA